MIDDNDGLGTFSLTLTGSPTHPTGGGVIAYSQGRKWIGGGLRFTKGGVEGATFLVQAINGKPAEATGSFVCGSSGTR
jgi:hypothetical protein